MTIDTDISHLEELSETLHYYHRAAMKEALSHGIEALKRGAITQSEPDEGRLLSDEEFIACAGNIPRNTDVEEAAEPWIFGARLIKAQRKLTASILEARHRAGIDELIRKIETHKVPRRYSTRPCEEFRIPSEEWQALSKYPRQEVPE